MSGKLTIETTVAYADVDRGEFMLLPRLFKLLQDAAITHANQFGVGTQAAVTRAETWLLNRISAHIDRYPKADEKLRVDTWSSGIRGFKGYRDFRVYDAQGIRILSASSLWLYFSTRTKSIVRVPREVAAGFPVGDEVVWQPDLEDLAFDTPAEATEVPLTLRYSDFDVNEHVNNAAYLDFVQSALHAAGREARPRAVRLKYAREIPSGTRAVAVRLGAAADVTRFSVEDNGVVFALGEVGST